MNRFNSYALCRLLARFPVSARWLALAIALTLSAGLALPPAAPAQSATTDLTVSAAVSLKDALEQSARQFAALEPGVAVHFNLGASGTLLQQIQQGAPVDLFLSASPDQMDTLAAQGLLLEGTRRNLARNTIVLIVPADRSQVASFDDLRSAQVKVIAVGEPQTVPAGKYAQQVLTSLGLYDALKPKFVLAKDVRQVLTYVISGDADAGIVYATDAMTSQQVKMVATAAEGSHSPVLYPVAVLKDSKNSAAAKEFEAFLLSAKGQAVFQKFGFSPAP